jgi:hypothetical protein
MMFIHQNILAGADTKRGIGAIIVYYFILIMLNL